MKKLTKDEVLSKIEKRLNDFRHLEFIDFKTENWKDLKNLILIVRCRIHNVSGEITYRSFMKNGWSCCKCKSSKISNSKRTNKDSVLENINKIINLFNSSGKGNISFLGFKDNYINGDSKLIIKCNIHNKIGYPSYYNFKKNKRFLCPECIKENVSKRRKITPKRAQEMINSMYGFDNRYSKIEETFQGYNKPVTLVCPIHGEYEILFKTLASTRGRGSCPKCVITGTSELEEICYNNIKLFQDERLIIRQLEINSRKKMFVDFYIPKLNVIIEYDGKQHYEFTSFFQPTYQNFVNQVNRDRCLEQYCKENNIHLLRIPYKDNNRIPEIIKIFFEEGKDITTKIEPKLLPVLYYG